MAHANSHGDDKHNDDLLYGFLDQSGVDIDDEQVTITLPEYFANEIEVWVSMVDATHVSKEFKAKRAKEILKRLVNHIKYYSKGDDNGH